MITADARVEVIGATALTRTQLDVCDTHTLRGGCSAPTLHSSLATQMVIPAIAATGILTDGQHLQPAASETPI